MTGPERQGVVDLEFHNRNEYGKSAGNCRRSAPGRFMCLLTAAVMALTLCAAGNARNVRGEENADTESQGDKVIEPTYIYDFTDDSTYAMGPETHCLVEETDDGVRMEVLEDDPNFTIGPMFENGMDACWIVIKYRGESDAASRNGEIYIATGVKEFSERTKVMLKWGKITGDWQILVTNSRMLAKLDEEIINVRYDPLSSAGGTPLSTDEWLETAYIAFFSNEEDARAFDYDAYIASIHTSHTHTPDSGGDQKEKWEKPAASERYVIGADNYKGTVELKPDTAAGTLAISYGEGAGARTFVVPDNAYFRNGPLAGTDELGRTLPDQFTVIDPDYVTHDEDGNASLVDAASRTVGVYGQNGTRYVGIFYFLWHGTMVDVGSNPRNIQELLDTYGDQAKDMPEIWAYVNATFYCAKPLYGYYRSDDEWVIRKHMELLTNAGVDFLYFDVTNNYLYERTAEKVMSILHEMNEQGYAAPKVVFYTNTDAKERVNQAYKTIYSKNVYPDTWMMLDGKPLIIAPFSANVDDFFTIRQPQWPNEDIKEYSWPWIDWDWPQQLHGKDFAEAISVSVAQHSGNCEFSSSGLYGYTGNRGRSYDGYRDAPTEDSYKQGTNIQLQFNRAIDSGVPYVLVTGWNEWIANRQSTAIKKYPIRFVDTFNLEYSRDIEMSEGGYFDSYYMQLIANTEAIRGAAPQIVRDDRHAIDIAGSFSQWDQVAHYYTDPSGDAAWRKSLGAGAFTLKDETGRNDIVRMKVTGDASYLYFYVECADNIKHGSGSDSWMRLFLNVDGGDSGWLGYDYIACWKTKGDNIATLAKAGGNDYGSFAEVAELSYQVDGNKMMIAIPLESLGIEYFNKIALSFKWVDSRSLINTPEQFYTEGDVAPLGRPDFTYRTYEGENEPEKLLKVVKLADRPAAYEKDQKGIDPIEGTVNKAVTPGWVLPVAIAGGAVALAAAGAGIGIAASKKRRKQA